MTSLEASIVTDYEQNGTSIEIIAADNGLEELSVKSVLLQYSKLYRDKQAASEEISKGEYEEYLTNLKILALGAESEAVRARLLLRLIDEKKGRLDKKPVGRPRAQGPRTVNINILQFNEQLRKSREKQLTDAVKGVIDVIPTETTKV
jgi:hypothetical protein